jgi:hypothetical protein
MPTSSGITYGGELEQATDPHYRDPQSDLTLEHELTSNTAVRASYVGESSYRLNATVNLNQQMPSTVSPNPNPTPFPTGERSSRLETTATKAITRCSCRRPIVWQWLVVPGELHLGA